MSLSQSTVSQHIRRLEELLDRPLFERDTRNVHLSQHGDALFRYAVRILELMDEAVTSVCGPPLSGKVRLAMSEDFASAHLTAALASFVQRNPEVGSRSRPGCRATCSTRSTRGGTISCSRSASPAAGAAA